MSSRDSRSRLFAALNELGRAIDKRTTYPARVGDGKGTVWADATHTSIYVRPINPTRDVQILRAKPRGIAVVHDAPVDIMRDKQGQWIAFRPNEDMAEDYWSGTGTVGDVGPHAATHGWYGPDPVLLSSFQVSDMLLVVPSHPLGLTVRVYPYFYQPSTTSYAYWGGDLAFDLSAYLPSLLNEQKFVIVGLDTSTNTLAVVEGTADIYPGFGAYALPFTGADVAAALEPSPDFVPSAAVRLKYGQTVIDRWDIFLDCRAWAGPNLSVTGSGGGSGVVIFETTLSSDETTLELPDIPADYTDLRLVVEARAAGSGGVPIATSLSFNDDFSDAHYVRSTDGGSSPVNDRFIGHVPDSSSPAGYRGSLEVRVLRYAGGAYKNYLTENVYYNTAISPHRFVSFGHSWEDTDAITKLTLSGDFAAGSVVRLLGK